jgi:glycosyltransferase involved in cell wall biosynthesis
MPHPGLIYLSPIAPARTGNGLAMRGYLLVSAASADFDVHVLVVPVAGRSPASPAGLPARLTELPLPAPAPAAGALAALLADPAWRARLTAAVPLPAPARAAPPTLAPAALQALEQSETWPFTPGPATQPVPPGPSVPGAVAPGPASRSHTRPDASAQPAGPGPAMHMARSYLAPLGLALAAQLGSPRVTLDLDDDDEALTRALGDDTEAAAYHRLISVFAPLCDAVALAAPAEAAAVSARHGLPTTVLPNAVELPAVTPAGLRAVADGPSQAQPPLRVLFAGNLTYPPNRDAALVLVREVLPRVRRLVRRPVTVTLAGAAGGDPVLAALGALPGVRVPGFVPDLAACYAGADVVVAPLLAGGGTRIKLLEAMAHGCPVVSTPAGAAGLAVTDGTDLLLAGEPGGLAAAVARLAADPGLAARIGAAGQELVRREYSHAAVIPRIRAFLTGAAAEFGHTIAPGNCVAAPHGG